MKCNLTLLTLLFLSSALVACKGSKRASFTAEQVEKMSSADLVKARHQARVEGLKIIIANDGNCDAMAEEVKKYAESIQPMVEAAQKITFKEIKKIREGFDDSELEKLAKKAQPIGMKCEGNDKLEAALDEL